jgi:osmotically-inducible protein OsmY
MEILSPKGGSIVVITIDEAIEQEVSGAISADEQLSGKEITVRVSRQVAVLKGTLDSLAELNRVERLAVGVDGVRAVDSSLIFIAEESDDWNRDSVILQEAEQALAKQPLLQESRVQVSVNKGRATLTGTSETLKEKLEAHRIISEIKGIASIVNLIEVEAEEHPAGDHTNGPADNC